MQNFGRKMAQCLQIVVAESDEQSKLKMAKAIVEWIVDGRPPEWSILSMTDIFEEEALKNKDGAWFVFNPRKPPPSLSPSIVQVNSVTYIGKWLEWVTKGKKKVIEPRFYSCKVLMVSGELMTIIIINSNGRVYSTGLQGTGLAENTGFTGYQLFTYINYR